MENFGELLNGLVEFVGGLGEAAGERAGEAAVESAVGASTDGARSTTATVDRYLCGGPRTLNVNDI